VTFGVVLDAGEVDHDAGLVSDHPPVVTGRNRDDVTGGELELRAVVQPDALTA